MENTDKQIQTVESNTEIMDTKSANSKLTAMMQFVKQNLKKGTDFMSIAGGKPTLLKSGAEKMNILMQYSAGYEKVSEIKNPTDQFYYVEVKCTLRNKQNQIVAECLASCNNKEKARANVPFYDALNSVLKVAEKRAYVGATLNANALSQFYTQDLEDDNNQTVVQPQKKQVKFACEECNKEIPANVADWSLKNHSRHQMLCIECQKINK